MEKDTFVGLIFRGQIMDCEKRITIWNVEQSRKISGNAAPKLKNLQLYLANNPHCQVYEDQDKHRKPIARKPSNPASTGPRQSELMIHCVPESPNIEQGPVSVTQRLSPVLLPCGDFDEVVPVSEEEDEFFVSDSSEGERMPLQRSELEERVFGDWWCGEKITLTSLPVTPSAPDVTCSPLPSWFDLSAKPPPSPLRLSGERRGATRWAQRSIDEDIFEGICDMDLDHS